jgi:protein gp37
MILALALTAQLSLAGAATAADLAEAAPSRAGVGLAQESGGGAKKKKVIRLDALTIEGRIQKPQAFYILQRSNLNFEELNRTESFIPKVEKSVEQTPF